MSPVSSHTGYLPRNVEALAQKFYCAIGTPLADRLRVALILGDWATIASCKVSPKNYTSSQAYYLDATAAAFLKKFSAFPTGPEPRKAAALANWREGESQCYKTNERLAPYLEGSTHPDYDVDVANHLVGIRKIVASILGRAPAMEHLCPRHGPGATFSDLSERSTIADKMGNSASFTTSACWFLPDWYGTAWGREASAANVYPSRVRGNRFTTAPKDALKDRPIAAEPSINIFYQLGLGREVRHRLKGRGNDLDVAAEIHRQVACEASISGSYATLDLSNASDTLAYSLVRLLLEPDWFALFSDLRSPFTRMSRRDTGSLVGRKVGDGDHWVKLEKFSSMGNGFTFELETLIFYAITEYATSVALGDSAWVGPTRVFGDDILCDSRAAEHVTALLRFLGFRLNTDKSFVGGPFRESCGGDFWAGRPVRPYFLKEPLDEPQQLIACANGIRRLGQDLFGGIGPLAGVWFSLQDQLPSRVRRCRGPSGLGDIVVHDDEVTWSWTSSSRTKIQAYVPVDNRRVALEDYAPGIVHACGLYGAEVSLGYLIPRASVTGHDVRRVFPHSSDWLPKPYIRRGGSQGYPPKPAGPTGPTYVASRVVRSGSLQMATTKGGAKAP